MKHCKRGVILRSTAEWEKKNTPTHARKHTYWHTEGFQQTLPKKGQKGQKKNKNKVNTVKNLKRGHSAFQISTTVSSGKEDRKGEEDYKWLSSRLQWDARVQLCCEPTSKCICKFDRDSGLQDWALNAYTTTGHSLSQSHLPTKQDAYVTTWVEPAANTRAQSAPATCSLLHT